MIFGRKFERNVVLWAGVGAAHPHQLSGGIEISSGEEQYFRFRQLKQNQEGVTCRKCYFEANMQCRSKGRLVWLVITFMLIVNPRRNEEEAKEYAVTIGQCDIHCTVLHQCKWSYYTLVALSQNFTGKGC